MLLRRPKEGPKAPLDAPPRGALGGRLGALLRLPRADVGLFEAALSVIYLYNTQVGLPEMPTKEHHYY